MYILRALQRPEYLFRPAQIVRRLTHQFQSTSAEHELVRLPWGLVIRVLPSETIGSSIKRLGVHELTVCECIGRLTDPGDLAVDAGANIGQMTSLMARRAGPKGEVIAFEPHPAIYNDLEHNVSHWQQSSFVAPITAHRTALSDCNGVAQLMVPSIYNLNHGIAFLAGSREWKDETKSYEVPVTVLDALIDAGRRVGLLKIDVEGHELNVLRGAQGLIASGLIRDIVFEQFSLPPTPVTTFLEQTGHTVFRVEKTLWGPILLPSTARSPHTDSDSLNYLATRDPDRALARISHRGWAVYSNRWPC